MFVAPEVLINFEGKVGSREGGREGEEKGGREGGGVRRREGGREVGTEREREREKGREPTNGIHITLFTLNTAYFHLFTSKLPKECS